jgi:heme-degrading monooxygenase HmoA
MPVAAIVRAPSLSVEAYDASAQQLGALVTTQPGFISHAALREGEGVLITEYWESEEQARRWYETTVRPAVEQLGLTGFVPEFHPLHTLLQRAAP